MLNINFEKNPTVSARKQNWYTYCIRRAKSMIVKVMHLFYICTGKLIVPHLDVLLTQRCNLRCRDCVSMMPYYTSPSDIDHRDVIENVNKFLDMVDGVFALAFVGGEPLLYKDLKSVIEAFIPNKKVFRIFVISNGMFIPKDDLSAILSDKKITLILSDYSIHKDKLLTLRKFLSENNIRYLYEKNKAWFPITRFHDNHYSKPELKKMFSQCPFHNCTMLYNEKIFTCSRLAHADALGFIPADENTPIDLNSIEANKNRIGQLVFSKYNEACNYCSYINERQRKLPAGLQLDKDEPLRKMT